MFPFVANALCPVFDLPMRAAAERHDNLRRYVGRMTTALLPGDAGDGRLQGGCLNFYKQKPPALSRGFTRLHPFSMANSTAV